jgi:hypothetical protein
MLSLQPNKQNIPAFIFLLAVVIAIATKWFAIALVPLTVVYITIQRWV